MCIHGGRQFWNGGRGECVTEYELESEGRKVGVINTIKVRMVYWHKGELGMTKNVGILEVPSEGYKSYLEAAWIIIRHQK